VVGEGGEGGNRWGREEEIEAGVGEMMVRRSKTEGGEGGCSERKGR